MHFVLLLLPLFILAVSPMLVLAQSANDIYRSQLSISFYAGNHPKDVSKFWDTISKNLYQELKSDDNAYSELQNRDVVLNALAEMHRSAPVDKDVAEMMELLLKLANAKGDEYEKKKQELAKKSQRKSAKKSGGVDAELEVLNDADRLIELIGVELASELAADWANKNSHVRERRMRFQASPTRLSEFVNIRCFKSLLSLTLEQEKQLD